MPEIDALQRRAAGNRVLDRLWENFRADNAGSGADSEIEQLLLAASAAVDQDSFIVHHADHGEPGQRMFSEVGATSPQFVAVARNRRAIAASVPGWMALANFIWDRSEDMPLY